MSRIQKLIHEDVSTEDGRAADGMVRRVSDAVVRQRRGPRVRPSDDPELEFIGAEAMSLAT